MHLKKCSLILFLPTCSYPGSANSDRVKSRPQGEGLMGHSDPLGNKQHQWPSFLIHHLLLYWLTSKITEILSPLGNTWDLPKKQTYKICSLHKADGIILFKTPQNALRILLGFFLFVFQRKTMLFQNHFPIPMLFVNTYSYFCNENVK